MNWFTTFLTSKIGQKFVISLTGIFLILFLIVHLLGNLQLLKNDSGVAFNAYAHFMTHNIFIEIIGFGLYFFILLHAVQGIALALKNRKARGEVRYTSHFSGNKGLAANNMALLGSLLLFFIIFHMKDFWWKYKYAGQVPDGNLYNAVAGSFSQGWIVIIYLVSLVVLYMHLSHGFASAFRTLGLHNKKYTPVIKFIGLAYSVLICLGFAIIPIIMYFNQAN